MSEEDRVAGLVDEAQLARWLDAQKLPGSGEPVAARFVSGGASNEIFEIRRGAVRMALRRPPRVVPKGRNETMLREARVLAALRDSDVPHARLLGVCDDLNHPLAERVVLCPVGVGLTAAHLPSTLNALRRPC